MGIFNATAPDGRPLTGIIYTSEYSAFAEREKFPWLLEIAIELEMTHENGLPAHDEVAIVNALEGRIVSAVADVMAVHRVARITGAGIRKVFCYIADDKTANTLLSIMRMTKQERPFRYGLTRDATWARAKQLGL